MFQIAYGLAGGFGGCGDWEDCDAATFNEAEQIAYDLACDLYDSYGGYHGLKTIETIMEEENVDARVAEEVLEEDMEDWIVYKVREIK